MSSLLPQGPGYLPSWLLFVSVLSLGNSLQAYLTTTYTRRVYASSSSSSSSSSSPSPAATPHNKSTPTPTPQDQVTPLQSRTFGTWTLLSALIRLYAAYHISDPLVYQLALWTYGIAWGHFVSEWVVFGTARWGRGLAGPVVVATGSLVWMGGQWRGYVGGGV